MSNVVFCVQVGCDCCCASRSSNYGYFDVSAFSRHRDRAGTKTYTPSCFSLPRDSSISDD
ncbi:hypothetical protein IG631_16139 [Alternaria alternata]|nr:hypothetical protein IG631_16139 [Alternaria alternata]